MRTCEDGCNGCEDCTDYADEDPHPDYPCRHDGRCQYAIDSGAEGLGHCPRGKCVMPEGARAVSALHVACILEQATYKPGDQAPEGYLEWHEWAEVQHKAGLRQQQCGRCGLWCFPQQLSATVDRTEVTGLRRRQPFRRTLETPVCHDCDKPHNVGGERTQPAGSTCKEC